jgi:hypothetical protein
MESGFLAIFLPNLSSPFSLRVSTMPLSLLAFSFRQLTFRVLFGFGKFKFIGASLKEFSYLRGFMINQPMPSVFGWLLYQLPLPVHVFSLFVFFLSEMVCPWFYFASGSWRISSALVTINLMLVINTSGNFGFFNFITSILCIPLLDGTDQVFRAGESMTDVMFGHGVGQMMVHFMLLFFLLTALCFFPFNSW